MAWPAIKQIAMTGMLRHMMIDCVTSGKPSCHGRPLCKAGQHRMIYCTTEK